jgi:Protein of unknown function (DUF736)
VFRHTDKVRDREPDYRIVQERDGAIVEFGAAGKRSDKGRDFLSIMLEDPALPASLCAALFLSDRGDGLRSSGSGRPRKVPQRRLNLRMRPPGGLRFTRSAPCLRSPMSTGVAVGPTP